MSEYTYENKRGSAKEKTKPGTVIGVIFSIVFSIIILCFLILLNSGLLFKFTCNDLINGDEILYNVDLKSIPIGEFVSSMDLEGVEIDEKTELADIVYDVFKGAQINVSSKEQVEIMLDNMDAESLLNSVKSEYLKVFLGEQKTASITTEQLMTFIEDNRKVIETAFATEFTDMDVAKIRYYLEWNNIEEQTTLELPEEYLEVIEIVRLFIGETSILNVIFGAGIVIILLLLLVCNWKRKYCVFLYAGLGFALPGAGGLWISQILGNLISQVLKVKSTMIDMLLVGASEVIGKNSVLFLTIGGGLMVVFIISAVVIVFVHRKNRM